MDDIPVYKKIAKDLTKRIDSRELTEKLPGQRELAQEYSVNVQTLRNALKCIEDDGLIYRKPSKGFFIRKLNAGIDLKQVIGIILMTEGHLYGEITRLLADGFQKRGYFLLIINTHPDQLDKECFQRQLEQLIGSEPAAILIDGYEGFPFEIFQKYRNYIKNLTLMFRDEYNFGDALRVLSDSRLGGRTGVLHLRARGCKRILFLMPSLWPLKSSAEKILAGALEALEESPEGETCFNVHCMDEVGRKILPSLLSKWKPDAIFAFADYLLKPVYEYAAENNLRIPDDIALLGYYNTPWAEAFPVPLSSVSIDVDGMTQCVIDKTLANINGASCKDTVMIKPELIERRSSSRS